MAQATTGYSWTSGDTVTPERLNSMVNNATVANIVNADVKSDAAIAFSKLAPLDSANILVGSASNVATKVAMTGDVTITNAGVTSIGSAKVVPAMLSQPLTFRTAQSTTGVTSIDFTDIPSWARRITVLFNNLSTNGASILLVRVGSGSIATSGYVANAQAAGSLAPSNAGFPTTYTMAAGYSLAGELSITQVSGFTYVAAGTVGLNSAPTTALNISSCAGLVTLGGAIDRVRITATNGTDTFDAGSVNIFYQ